MLKSLIKSIGFTEAPVISEADREALRLQETEDRLLAISLKAYRNQPSRPSNIPLIEVTEITDPVVIQDTMARFEVLPNKHDDGKTISECEYERARLDKGKDVWKGVAKRTIR